MGGLLNALIQDKVEHGGAPEGDALAKVLAKERSGRRKGLQGGEFRLLIAQDAGVNAGVLKVGGDVNAGNADDVGQAGVPQLGADKRNQLLAEQGVETV